RVHLVEAVFESLDARPLQAEAQLLLGSDEVIHLQLWRPLVGLEGGHTSTPLMDEPRLAVNILGAEVHRDTGRRTPGHTCRVAEAVLAGSLVCAVARGEDRHRTGPVAAPGAVNTPAMGDLVGAIAPAQAVVHARREITQVGAQRRVV